MGTGRVVGGLFGCGRELRCKSRTAAGCSSGRGVFPVWSELRISPGECRMAAGGHTASWSSRRRSRSRRARTPMPHPACAREHRPRSCGDVRGMSSGPRWLLRHGRTFRRRYDRKGFVIRQPNYWIACRRRCGGVTHRSSRGLLPARLAAMFASCRSRELP